MGRTNYTLEAHNDSIMKGNNAIKSLKKHMIDAVESDSLYWSSQIDKNLVEIY